MRSAKLSRLSLVEQALLRPGGIVASARKEAAVTGFGLADDITPLELIHGDSIATSLNAAPDGDKSDLTAGIARGVGAAGTRGGPVLRWPAGGGRPDHRFRIDAQRRADFYGQRRQPRSAARCIVQIGQRAGQRLRRAGHRCEGRAAPRRVRRPRPSRCIARSGDEKEEIRKIVLHDGKDAAAEFSARLSKLNPQNVERVRLWFPKIPGEASGDNNQAERWVKVVPQRMKVMLVAGTPTWDFQYVRGALARLPEMQVKEIVLDPVNPRIWIQPKEILSQDVIVLFDVPVSALDEKHWDAVQRMAQVTGGSVILVAGDAHLPGEYSRFASTAALLPFAATFKPAWSTWPGPAPAFHFVPAPDAETLDFLKLPPESRPKAAAPKPATPILLPRRMGTIARLPPLLATSRSTRNKELKAAGARAAGRGRIAPAGPDRDAAGRGPGVFPGTQ